MKHENERERYPNGVSISAKRISGRSYGYTVHYDGGVRSYSPPPALPESLRNLRAKNRFTLRPMDTPPQYPAAAHAASATPATPPPPDAGILNPQTLTVKPSPAAGSGSNFQR
jgi:hypothetical protein